MIRHFRGYTHEWVIITLEYYSILRFTIYQLVIDDFKI